jgi:hypothetical protein
MKKSKFSDSQIVSILKKAEAGAAMRKLLSLCLGVLKSGVPFDPNYQSIHLLASRHP